jgi:GntR family transcriptional regulator/MocR family aminotransferase
MSYMVIPQALMVRYQQVFNRYNTFVPWLEQKIVEAFITGGHWERHIRRVRLANKRRHDTLVRALMKTMGKRVNVLGQNAGLHLILEFGPPVSEAELIRQALAHGVAVSPVSRYWARPGQYKNNMVVLGFSGLDEGDIIKGVDRLSEAWFSSCTGRQ